MKYILQDNQNRKKLCEGRTQGLASGTAKPSFEGDTVTLVTTMPPSPCKDFLAEPTMAEATGRTASAHGLTSKKEGIFDSGMAYIVIAVLPPNHGTSYPDMKKDIAALEANHKHMQAFVNYFEDKIGIEGRTIIEPTDKEGWYAMIVPLYWIKTSYIISLHGLIVRSALHWTGAPDPVSYLEKIEGEDTYLWTNVLPKLKRLMEGEPAPVQDWDKISCPHNMGCYDWKMPAKIATKAPEAPRTESAPAEATTLAPKPKAQFKGRAKAPVLA